MNGTLTGQENRAFDYKIEFRRTRLDAPWRRQSERPTYGRVRGKHPSQSNRLSRTRRRSAW